MSNEMAIPRYIENLNRQFRLFDYLEARGHGPVGADDDNSLLYYNCMIPLHDDRFGLFVLDENSNSFHCDHCRVAGGVVELVMALASASLAEAVTEVARFMRRQRKAPQDSAWDPNDIFFARAGGRGHQRFARLKIELDRSMVDRRAKEALALRYIENIAPQGKDRRLVPEESIPADGTLFPTVDELKAYIENKETSMDQITTNDPMAVDPETGEILGQDATDEPQACGRVETAEGTPLPPAKRTGKI